MCSYCPSPEVSALGLCSRCYERNRRSGSPEYRRRKGVPADCPLTSLQLAALTHLAEGKTRKQAAVQLCKSYKAVRQLVNRASQRLGVDTAQQAITLCGERRWLEIKCPKARGRPEPSLSEVQRDYARAFTALIKTSPSARERLFEGLVALSQADGRRKLPRSPTNTAPS